jgi:DNA-binding transcriptional LysR family regulator
MCNEHRFYPNVSIHCDDPYYILQYVEANLGITVAPSVAWKNLFNENVVVRKFEDAPLEYAKKRTLVTYDTRKYMHKSVKLFKDLLLEEREKYR